MPKLQRFATRSLLARHARQYSARPGSNTLRNVRHPQPRPGRQATSLPKESTVQQLFRDRKWPLLGAGAVATVMGLYLALILPSLLSPPSSSCPQDDVPTGRPPALSGSEAKKFDRSLDFPEMLTGITSLRQRVARKARGHVLEVAMGTGRNIPFYGFSGLDADWPPGSVPAATKQSGMHEKEAGHESARNPHILSFTGLDISIDMLNVALSKFAAQILSQKDCAAAVVGELGTVGDGGEVSYLSGRIRVVGGDAQLPLPPPLASLAAGGKYDTVIQTFGLCSVSDPCAVLVNLAKAVAPGTGRIVLLEHGRGTWGLVNKVLDKQALAHFRKYGCWWNRDIEGIVQEAAKQAPGLEIVRIDRPYVSQMGTVLYVELRVKDVLG